jgi:hypothetical protein
MAQPLDRSLTAVETSEAAPPSEPGSAGFRPPSIPAVVFVLLALVIPFGLQQPVLNADGDLARHLRHGRWMLEHRQLVHQDPFSFTRPGAPFLGFEYGMQLLYALAERFGGLPAVAILAGLIIATAYGLLARFLLRRGVDPLLAYLTTMVAAVLGAGHWLARPHLISFVLSLVLLEMLESRRQPRYWIYALLFAVWANLHGGYVLGWILIGIYLCGTLLEYLSSRAPEEAARARHLAAALAISIAAALLNPYGIELHRHVIQFFGERFIMDNTAEFVSPNFHDADGKIFLVALLLCLVAIVLTRRRPSAPRLLLVLVLIAFALTAIRNIALFGLLAVPIVALHINSDWERLSYGRGFRERFNAAARRTSTWPWIVAVTVFLVVLAGFRGRVGSVALLKDGFDPQTFPISAVKEARRAGLQGHLFSEFAWGGYLIYAWPEQRIFIDGGTDFFGSKLFEEYATIRQMRPGWRVRMDKWDISLALLRRKGALAHELVRDPRWSLWYCDSLAVLLQRSGPARAVTPAESDSAEARLDRCQDGQMRTADPTSERPHGSERYLSTAASTPNSVARNSLTSFGAMRMSERIRLGHERPMTR